MARILVIDDDPSIRRAVRRMLERAGHEVLDAGDGEAGIELFRRQPVDLVLTDMQMPGAGGAATMKRLREEAPGVKIIAISGGGVSAPADPPALAKSTGATRALRKPFEMRDLLTAVREVLEERPPGA